MDVENWVRERGGIVRAAQMRRDGASSRAISTAVATGVLQRPRRGWLALPDVDPYLYAAARAGVVLTCITQARRLGLWVLDEHKPHVAAPPNSGVVTVERVRDPALAQDRDAGERRAVVHWAAPLVPREPSKLVDPIENVLAMVALCRPFESALAIWESAMRQGLVEREAMELLPLPSRARAVLAEASLYSDSGLESFVVPRLRWLRVRILPQVWILGHRVDFLIGSRLAFQIDGGTHVGAQREEDIRHDAALMLAGYHVIRVGYRQMVDDWPSVQATIMLAIAQGLHSAA